MNVFPPYDLYFYLCFFFSVQSDDFKPLLEKGNATFAKYSYTTKEFAYRFMTDATNMSEVDLIWTNSDEFNIMNFDIDASMDVEYDFDHIPPIPRYIRNMKFGIVDAHVLVVHLKLGQSMFNLCVAVFYLVYIFVQQSGLCILILIFQWVMHI